MALQPVSERSTERRNELPAKRKSSIAESVKSDAKTAMTTTPETQSNLLGLIGPVIVVGAVLTLLAPFVVGARDALGVAIGAAIGAANLWAIASVVRGLVRGNALPWGAVAALKFGALVFVVWIVLKNHWAAVGPLALGYAALPLGIVIGQLRGNAPAREEG
jgi:hypothetical protein